MWLLVSGVGGKAKPIDVPKAITHTIAPSVVHAFPERVARGSVRAVPVLRELYKGKWEKGSSGQAIGSADSPEGA